MQPHANAKATALLNCCADGKIDLQLFSLIEMAERESVEAEQKTYAEKLLAADKTIWRNCLLHGS